MSSETTPPSVSRRAQVSLAIAVLIALLLGILIGRSFAPDEGVAQPESSPPSTEKAEDVYAQTQAGAVEAATDFARVVAAASADEDGYRESVKRFAAPAWESEAARLAENTLDFLEQRYGLDGSFSFVPARYRIADFSRTEATIQLWGVTLSSGPKLDGIEETWITGTVELAWTESGWRVSGQDSVTGPTPELLQTEDERAGNVLEGFEEYPNDSTP